MWEGGSLSLSARVSGQVGGDPVSYRWYRQTGTLAAEALREGGVWEGVESGTLRAGSVTLSEAGMYWVVAESASSGAAQSVPALVWVNARNPIRVHPQPVLAMEGGTAGFAVEAVGEALRYRWMRDGVELSGADARYAGWAVRNWRCAVWRCWMKARTRWRWGWKAARTRR